LSCGRRLALRPPPASLVVALVHLSAGPTITSVPGRAHTPAAHGEKQPSASSATLSSDEIVATETVIRFRARREDIERADLLAHERGVTRSELLRGLLADADSGRPEPRLAADDLVALLEARARGGHLPAILALLKRETPAPPKRPERSATRRTGGAGRPEPPTEADDGTPVRCPRRPPSSPRRGGTARRPCS
jgi:hypothetical protein